MAFPRARSLINDSSRPALEMSNSHPNTGRVQMALERSNFPRLDSSEDPPTVRSDIFDAKFWQSEDDTFDASRTSPESDYLASLSAVDLKVEADWEDVEIYNENLRPHGVPLDTITEKSSIVPLSSRRPARYLFRDIGAAGRKSSAPVILARPRPEQAPYSISQSLDETVSRPRRAISLNAISEASDFTSRPSVDLAFPAVPPVESPIMRAKTPPGLPRWPADLPRDNKPAPRQTRTSAYVRGIYERLIGAHVAIEASPSRPQSTPLPSRIPVPRHLARGGRTGSGYWRPPASGHACDTPFDTLSNQDGVVKSEEDVSRNTRSEPQRDNQLQLSENARPPKTVTTRLSGLINHASRLFELKQPPSIVSLSGNSQAVQDPTHRVQTIVEGDSHATEQPQVFEPLRSPALPAQSDQHSPAKSVTTSMLTPEPLIIRGRSLSHAGALRQTQELMESSPPPETPNRWKTLPDIPRSVDAACPGSCRSSHGSSGSWALPLTPLPFPSPPSPNVYSTPPAHRNLRDDTDKDRFSNDGIPVEPPTGSSLRSFDAATDQQVLDRIMSSNTNSSTSLVAGRSLYQPPPQQMDCTSDIFADLPTLRVTNPSDELDEAPGEHRTRSHVTPLTPIQIPSPLRPRFKPNPQYSLFPDTQSPKAKLPPFAPGMPIIRAIRSVSSRLRAVTSPQPPVQVSNTTTAAISRSRHGHRGENQRVFPHPLEKIQRRRSKTMSVQQRKAKKDHRRQVIRRAAIWVPTHCFCQPMDDTESFRGPHPRPARPMRMAERRNVLE